MSSNPTQLQSNPITYTHVFASDFPVGTIFIDNDQQKTKYHLKVKNGLKNKIGLAWDTFLPGAQALLPDCGVKCIKVSDIWLQTPSRIAKPIYLTPQRFVSMSKKYRIIKTKAYNEHKSNMDTNQDDIVFHIPMRAAEEGNFDGASQTAMSSSGSRKKAQLFLDILGPMENVFGGLASKTDQINAIITKGPLAKRVFKEVEKVFDFEHNDILAFEDSGDEKFRKKITLDDLFLVKLVRLPETAGSYQLMLAVHIEESD